LAPAREIRLESHSGQAKLIRSDEHVAAGVRVGVEALEQEFLADARIELKVDRVVVGVPLSVPETEVPEVGEPPRAGRRTDGVRLEAEREIAVADVDEVEREAQPVGHL